MQMMRQAMYSLGFSNNKQTNKQNQKIYIYK